MAHPPPHPSEEVAACLRYFNVSTVQAWRSTYATLQSNTAFRTSATFESRPAAVAAWLRRGEIIADAITCRRWSPERFRQALSDIRPLTRKREPDAFFPTLQKSCAECGVAVAVVRAPQGCRASGATRFTGRTKALLQLSFRYLTDDQFWFTFFHEAAHLLLHNHADLFLEGVAPSSTKQEEEANEFAAEILIPKRHAAELSALRADHHQVLRFAKKVGVSPGIVVGQLQHQNLIKPNHLNGLKRHLQWH